LDPSEIAAWWGASIATLVLAWDVYKWKTSGPKLSMCVSPNMIVIGDPEREGKTWVSVTISNIGNLPTTLKGIGMEHYNNLFARIRRKPSVAAIFPNPNTSFPLPRILNPGDEWTGLIPQKRVDKNVSLEELAKNGHLMIWVSQSHSQRSKKVRLILKDGGKKPES
jgi:hypothetical protein